MKQTLRDKNGMVSQTDSEAGTQARENRHNGLTGDIFTKDLGRVTFQCIHNKLIG